MKQSYTVQHIVRSSTLFTFGYPNLILPLLQYISFYFNINIATFVAFQIAVYAYVNLCCVLLHTLRYDCVIQYSVMRFVVISAQLRYALRFPNISPPDSADNIALTLRRRKNSGIRQSLVHKLLHILDRSDREQAWTAGAVLVITIPSNICMYVLFHELGLFK